MSAQKLIRGITENDVDATSDNTDTIAAMLLKRPDDGITVPEAAERIGVDAQTVRNWIRTGKLPATRWGPDKAKIIRVDPADLEGLGPRLVTPREPARRKAAGRRQTARSRKPSA